MKSQRLEKPKFQKFDSEEKTERDFRDILISESEDVPTEIRYASPMVISTPESQIDPTLLAKMSELKIKLN